MYVQRAPTAPDRPYHQHPGTRRDRRRMVIASPRSAKAGAARALWRHALRP